MSLLYEIQEAIVDAKSDLGPILLKLRLLADRLGSDQLEEWVKYESEGYPPGAEIPDYRHVAVRYAGNFSNVAWQSTNQPIPTALVREFAGERWVRFQIRESIAAIDELLRNCENGGGITIDTSNLILVFQGKIMEGMNCNSVTARISATAVQEIQNTVRAKILELTMKLAREVPSAADVKIGRATQAGQETAEKVSQVFNLTVHGPNTMVTSTGDRAQISVSQPQGDSGALVAALVKGGIPRADAKEFGDLVSNEEPESADEPFGPKARSWLARNIQKAVDGTWTIGLSVATKVLEEAALRYYGLKGP